MYVALVAYDGYGGPREWVAKAINHPPIPWVTRLWGQQWVQALYRHLKGDGPTLPAAHLDAIKR